MLQQACAMELEGVVSKRTESPYRSGRNSSWTKVRCRHRETFVLVGLAARGRNSTACTSAGGEARLIYARKVDTGSSEPQVQHLQAREGPLTTKRRPIERVAWGRGISSQDGLLRHPSYKGLRETSDYADFSRRTPLNFFLLFFTSMKRPLSLLRFVHAVLPIKAPLRWVRLRTAPFRALSPVGLFTATCTLL